MRKLLVTISLFSSCFALVAQTAAPAGRVDFATVQSENCPVSFTASRWRVGTVDRALAATEPREKEHGIYLRVPVEGSKAILSAVAVVHGSGPTPRAELVGNKDTSDLTQTFHIAGLLRESSGRVKLTTDNVPFVREIDLTEMHFADGSAWHESPSSHCRVTPNGFLSVAGSKSTDATPTRR
jgi:hypothetical protein